MSDRLRPRDLAFLATESPRTPMHNATVEIFDPGESGFDYARLVELIADRIAFVPRYRQRLQWVPGRLATPVWVDDPDFELSYHVRRSALPRPGDHNQLRELVARIASRPLDRSRPLWETYFVEGLAGGRVAVLTKSHQILVDGRETVDIGQVLLDTEPDRPELGHDEWRPRGRPDALSLALGALTDSIERPSTLIKTVQANTESVVRTANAARHRFSDVAGALAGRKPVASSPINRPLSQQRRFLTIHTQLDDYKRIRRIHGGTINDVILATLTGGLRGWLMTRTESMAGSEDDQGDRADVGDRRRAGADLARHPDRRPHGQPADLRALSRWSASTRSATASRATRRPVAAWAPSGSPASPVSRRRRSTRSARAWPRRKRAAASTCR